MSSPTTNITNRPAYFKPDVVIQVSNVNDLPDPIAGVFLVETGNVYELNTVLVTSNRFTFASGAINEIYSVSTASLAGIVFTGGDKVLFTASETGFVVIQAAAYVDTIGTATFCDYSSTILGSGFNLTRLAVFGFARLGDIVNTGSGDVVVTAIAVCFFNDYIDGLHFGDHKAIKLDQISGSQMVANSGGTYLSFDGSNYDTIIIRDCDIKILDTGQSFMFINPAATVASGIVSGSAFDDADGATYFRQAKAGTITMFADDGSGSTIVTSAGHGLGDNVQVTQTGTTNYNGTFTATFLTNDTYLIDTAFVADDGTGSWTSPASIDQDDIDWEFENNGDVLDSAEVGSMTLDAPTTVTISDVGVSVVVGGTWSSAINRRMDFVATGPDNGKFTYIGLAKKPFVISGKGKFSSNGNDVLETKIKINGIDNDASMFDDVQGSIFTSSLLVELETGDEIEFAAQNNTDLTDITADNVSLNIHSTG